MKRVWVIRYWLEEGPVEIEGYEHQGGDFFGSRPFPEARCSFFYNKKEWFATKKAAIDRIKELAEAKKRSLDRQRKKVNKILGMLKEEQDD